VLVADAGDAEALRGVSAQTDVVVSLVGPYGSLGDELPRQCVSTATHYADLCGENDVIDTRIAGLHESARCAGVKLISACGYESVPFDFGALKLDEEFRQADRSRLERVDAESGFVLHRHPLRLGTGISGGTLATIRGLVEAGELTDPYRFVPGEVAKDPALRAANAVELAARRSASGDWLAPLFPTPFLNSAIVHRTSALLGGETGDADGEVNGEANGGYSPRLVYREAMNVTASLGSAPLAALAARTVSALMRNIDAMAGGRRSFSDRLTLLVLRRLAKPGEGPPLDSLRAVDYRVDLRASSTTGLEAGATVHGLGHPGYLSSPNILAEIAIGLARDKELPKRYGVLTPASALGAGFTTRLAKAGLSFDVRPPLPRVASAGATHAPDPV
jgi:short subunit dehydrogenase-like uncharacterized protein